MLCAKEKSNEYQFYSVWFDPIGLEPMIYRTQGKHADHYATDVVVMSWNENFCCHVLEY